MIVMFSELDASDFDHLDRVGLDRSALVEDEGRTGVTFIQAGFAS